MTTRLAIHASTTDGLDCSTWNRLIAEQHSYDIEEQKQLAAEHIPTLNQDQLAVFNAIVNNVFSYMDLKALERHMSITPSVTFCMVRTKLFFVWLHQE